MAAALPMMTSVGALDVGVALLGHPGQRAQAGDGYFAGVGFGRPFAPVTWIASPPSAPPGAPRGGCPLRGAPTNRPRRRGAAFRAFAARAFFGLARPRPPPARRRL